MTYPKLVIRAALAMVAGLGIATSTWGATTSLFDVTARVVQKCSISATALGFGDYDPLVTNATNPLAQTTTLSITCTKGSGSATAVTVGITAGANFANATLGMTRAMRIPATTNYLSYDLYQPNGLGACTSGVWGDTVATRVTASSTFGVGAPVTLNVCGSVPGAQDVVQGNYTDTVTAQVYF